MQPVFVVVVILYVGEMAGDGREKAYEKTKINLFKLFLISSKGKRQFWGGEDARNKNTMRFSNQIWKVHFPNPI